MIGVFHVGISMVTKTPEMVLDDSEAQLLAKATVPVLDQFNFVPDPRFAAVFGLLAACGQVYGPRAMLIYSRRSDERASRPARSTPQPVPQPSTVIAGDFSGMQPGSFTS